MSSAFQFSDLGRVAWLPTLKLVLGRGFAAGLVWTILLSIGEDGLDVQTSLLFPFVWALIALPFVLFTGVIGRVFGRYIPIIGASIMLVGSIFVCVGDPLIYLINRSFPRLFDIAGFRLFNFQPLIFIFATR